MKKQITKTNETEWKPLFEEGIKTNGIYVKILRYDEETKRPPTFLLKFDTGASYPNHNHPAGEEVFILEGEVRFGPDHLIILMQAIIFIPRLTQHIRFFQEQNVYCF
jgi:quercetin dioxygenase-like cupin family protein